MKSSVNKKRPILSRQSKDKSAIFKVISTLNYKLKLREIQKIMNEQIQEILENNLKNKQLIDLLASSVNAEVYIAQSDKTMASYGLFNLGGLSAISDNLSNLSKSLNDVDAKLSDILEVLDNG